MSDLWEDLLEDVARLQMPGKTKPKDTSPISGKALPKRLAAHVRPTGGAPRSAAPGCPKEKTNTPVQIKTCPAEDVGLTRLKPSNVADPPPEYPVQPDTQPYTGSLPALMTSLDPGRNRHRWYAFRLQESFFGDLSVVCSWGGIGQKACGQKAWRATDEAAARLRISRLMAKRRSRGYRLLRPGIHQIRDDAHPTASGQPAA